MPQKNTLYDLIIVGGGVNGCGLARDAAGRGAEVFLMEEGDIGGGTTSASSGIVHGGIHLAPHNKFQDIESLKKEREVFLRLSPHIAKPVRLLAPPEKIDIAYWIL